MNRKEVKSFWPILQAFADGKEIECHKEDKWYSITQIMIWRVIEPDAEFYFTDKLNGKKIDIYDKEIKQIEKLVEQHNKVPSFSFDDLTFSINSTNTLTDSGKVLEDYEIESKSDNIDVKISGNKMTVTTHDESASFIKFDGAITPITSPFFNLFGVIFPPSFLKV